MKIFRRLLFSVVLCLTPQHSLADDDWSYTLRPGDDLWTLAKKFCGSANLAPRIARHNGLTDLTRIRAGERIKIPTNWLVFEPSVARISKVSGLVRVQQSTQYASPQSRAVAGDRLLMGYSIVTEQGSALVEFADGSTIAIEPNSKVLFNKLTAFGPAGMVDTHLRFSYGRGSAVVIPRNLGNRFRIQTPQGIAAVRGTHFRVGHIRTDKGGADDDGISNTETLEGEVSFTQFKVATALPAGYGVTASKAGVVKEELLRAPSGFNLSNQAQMGQTVSWNALADARNYVVTWAASDNPEVLISSAIVAEPSFVVQQPPGEYSLRVRGVSSNGIEGFDYQQSISIIKKAPRLNVPISASEGTVNLSWRYPNDEQTDEYIVTISASAGAGGAPQSGQGPSDFETGEEFKYRTSRQSLDVDLPPGEYSWQVVTEDSAESAPGKFVVLPNAPKDVSVKVEKKQLSISWASGESSAEARYEITILDSTGATILREEVRTTSFTHELTRFGRYEIQLATIQNSLQSEAITTHAISRRPPWWLLILLVPLLAL